ncbi:MAG: transglutaminase domain-containing protein [Chloroflexi bacterium]|nr:transglutaminase domain-containing protein [Chloroflexota bacterium]
MVRDQIKIGEGISAALLLFLMLFSVVGSIAVADWADGLGVLAWATLAGMIFGGALAKSRAPGWLAHCAMVILAPPITALSVSTLLPDALTFEQKLIVLQERMWVWLQKVIAGGTSVDALIFVIQLTFAMWVLAYIAAWFVYRRHQIWGAIIPPGIALTLNLFYAAPQPGLYLGLFVASALLLIVRLNLLTMERAWRSASIGYASDISFDFLMYGIGFSLLLIFVVWLVPATAPGPAWLAVFDPVQEPWQRVEAQFNRVFGALRAVGRPGPATFFGTTLNLGGPVRLGDRAVMQVQTDYGRYWRATVYDKYTGIGWINTRLDAIYLSANDTRFEILGGGLRVPVTQTFKIFLPDQSTLFAASQPLRFSIPIEIRYAPISSVESDIALARARRPLREGETYTVVSSISVADEESLRADSITYAQWISATYLQLPDDLPARVRTLAQTITAKEKNPYDKAAAIENYLRAKIKYNDAVSAPPTGRDGIDYTLFDRPEGYCNYYASAMAVLARAAGIPARVASGYALGDYRDGAFHVVESAAHAWPELYFPGYGWIEFEPTANQPGIERPKKSESGDQPELDPNLPSRRSRADLEDEDVGPANDGRVALFTPPSIDARIVAFALGALATISALGALAVVIARRARRFAQRAPAARVYEAMLARARWFGIREQTFATPLERACVIADALPNASAAANQVATLYTRERYAARALDADERALLQIAWENIRQEAWRGLTARVIEKIVAPARALIARIERIRARQMIGE